jgi:lipopolysaccharide assembly outer membrane protein LptD (OstA)
MRRKPEWLRSGAAVLIPFFVLCALGLLPADDAAAYDLPSSTGTHHVQFESDFANFNEYSRDIDLEGNVKLHELSPEGRQLKFIRARYLTVSMASHTVISPSDFVMDDDTGTVYGKSGTMDYRSDSGHIADGRFAYRNFIFSGRVVDFTREKYIYKKASVTTCDAEPPDYRMRSTRIYLVPGRYFLAYNNVLFIGKVPVLYLPILYKPLGAGTPFVSIFRPGYDKRNGAYMKSTYLYRINRETRAKVFLDYFSRQGLGTGAEFDYKKPEKDITDISAYRIREYGQTKDRWGLNGGYWHLFNRFNESDPAQYYSQGTFRLLSDPNVNNNFFRSNPFAVSPDEQASLALTRKTAYTVTRLSASGTETKSADSTVFQKSNSSIPRLDFNTIPFRVLGLPVLNTFTSYIENARDAGTTFTQERGGANWTVNRSVPLVKGLTLSPSVFYGQSLFVSTMSTGEISWVGRYGGGANLRYEKLWGSLDLGYTLQHRLRTDKMEDDRAAADKGQETSAVTSQLFVMPMFNTYYKLSTSYDMRTYYTAGFDRRLQPITAEVYYSPRQLMDIFATETYSVHSGTRSFVAQMNFGDKVNYLGGGIANYSNDPRAWIISNTLGLRPWRGSSWRIEAVLRYRLVSEGGLDVSDFRFFEKSLILYKDFHDFHTRWDFMERSGGVKEFRFYINLKMNDPSRKDDLEEKSREYWHPWRKEGDERDL